MEKSEVASRLAHLVPHWIEHNDSHAEQFEEWAEQARGCGLSDIGDAIEAAARSVREANGELEGALARLPARQ